MGGDAQHPVRILDCHVEHRDTRQSGAIRRPTATTVAGDEHADVGGQTLEDQVRLHGLVMTQRAHEPGGTLADVGKAGQLVVAVVFEPVLNVADPLPQIIVLLA